MLCVQEVPVKTRCLISQRFISVDVQVGRSPETTFAAELAVRTTTTSSSRCMCLGLSRSF